MSGSFSLLARLAGGTGPSSGEKLAWARAYDAWCRHVNKLAAGRVTPTRATQSFVMGTELREVVVEEVQTHLALRALDIVTHVVPNAMESHLPLGDREAVLNNAATPEWAQALKKADGIVDRYVRSSLANRATSELRMGYRRAEQELRAHAALGTAADRASGDGADETDADAEDAYRRAMAALDAAVAHVLGKAPEQSRQNYEQQCADLHALAEARCSMDGVVLREMALESPTVAARCAAERETVAAALDALHPSQDVEMLRDLLADPRKLEERARRDRATLERLESEAGRSPEAVDGLARAVSGLAAVSAELRSSDVGERVRGRIYKAHERMRTQLSAALSELEGDGRLQRAEVEFANRLVTELLHRRCQTRSRAASVGQKESS